MKLTNTAPPGDPKGLSETRNRGAQDACVLNDPLTARGCLHPHEAESLSNALLRTFGQNEEYPCLLTEPEQGSDLAPLDDPGGAGELSLVAPATSPVGSSLSCTEDASGPGGRLRPHVVACATIGRLLRALVEAGVVDRRTLASSGPRREVKARRLAGGAPPYLLAVMASLVVKAELTPRQRDVARLMLWGWEVGEIAEELAIAQHTVRRLWARARSRWEKP